MKVNLLFFVVVFVLGGILSSCSKKKPEIQWVDIKAGSFIMGSPETENYRKEDEKQHQVTLSAFRMSKNEITVAEFKAFIDATDYITTAEKGSDGFKGSVIWNVDKFEKKAGVNWKCDVQGNPLKEADYNQPVMHISWIDANAFAKWMDCRLPTEAEWEYAARAGTSTAFNQGNCISADAVNYNGKFPGSGCKPGQYRGKVLPVGSLPPNVWGLCDMHGNVAEWCADIYAGYPDTPQTNPKGVANNKNHVIRGGSWRDNAANCRSAARTKYFHEKCLGYLGFRIVSEK